MNFERLEARQLLATLVVGNSSDVTNGNTSSITALIADSGGDGISLREATIASNNTDGADAITFAPAVFTGGAASVIRLTQGELTINETLTIDGASGAGIVITGDANNNDVTLSSTNVTDVGASLAANSLSLDDNSRVINFSDADGTLTLSNLTLTGGRTTGENANGGGVYATLGGVRLINSTVSGNSIAGDLSDGGGVHAYSGNVTLTNSTVSGNRTSGYSGYGGGIFASSGTVSLTNSTVSDNATLAANSDGGGIFTSTGDVTLIGSTISGNQTNGAYSEGGGILTYAGNVSLINSTVSGNRTIGYQSYGAGLYTSSGTVTLTNSTVVGNITNGGSANGGGIFALDSSISIRNSIVAGNIVNNGTAPDLRPGNTGTLTVSHSLIGNTSGSGVTGSTGSGNILNQSASLGPLSDNGGLTLTHAPLSGSPVINAGNNALAVSDFGGSLISDQRGGAFDRIEFGTVDMGAVEVQAAATALSIVSATINEGGVLSRPDIWNTVTVVFDSDANVTIGDLLLFNDSRAGIGVNLTGILFSYNATTHTAVWDFTGFAPLEAALYTYRLDGGISSSTGLLLDGNGDGVGGDDFVAEHYVAIPGDANLDGQVNVLGDAFALVANLNSTGNLAWSTGNFNGDAVVNVLSDAFILVANLGRDVRPPTALSIVSAKVNEGGELARPDLLNTLTVDFNADANVSAGDLSLFNDSQGGTAVNLSGVDFSYNATTNTAVWDFTDRAPLAAAFYTYQLDSAISSTTGLVFDGNNDGSTGDDFVAQHYVAIPGDANLDGLVDVLTDAFALIANLNTDGAPAWSAADLNNDGLVNILGDAFILVSNLSRDVRPLLTATAFAGTQSPESTSSEIDLILAGAHNLRDEVFGDEF